MVPALLFSWGFLLISVCEAALIPQIKWAQTNDNIYLTLEADCVEATITIALTVDQFGFNCTGTDGLVYEVQFTLREDIDPKQSSCVVEHDHHRQFCTLIKKEAHTFDRLPHSEAEQTRLQKYLSIDWRRHKPQEEEESDDAPLFYFDRQKSSVVKRMKLQDLELLSNQKKTVFVDIGFPWCQVCKQERAAFTKAAEKIPEALFGYIDAREDVSARRLFEPSCNQGCRVHVFSRSEEPTTITTVTSLSDMETKLRLQLTPLLTQVQTSEELQKIRAAADHGVLLGLFNDESSEAYYQFADVAVELRAGGAEYRILIAIGTNLELDASPPALVFIAPDGHKSVYADDVTSEKLTRFAKIYSIPVLQDYDWTVGQRVRELGLGIAHVWIEKTNVEQNALIGEDGIIKRLAQQFRGKLIFVQLSKTHSWLLTDFGLDKSKFPAFGIEDPKQPGSDHTSKYGYEGEFEFQSLLNFCQGYLSKQLRPSYRSDPIPTEQVAPGDIHKLVWKTLEPLLPSDPNRKSDVVLALYKPWFHNWEKIHTTLVKVSRALRDVPGIIVAAIDTTHNYFAADELGLEDFQTEPVILFLPRVEGSAKNQQYPGTVSQKGLFGWLKKLSPAVRDGWEILKQTLKDINQEEAAAKKHKESEEKERESLLTNAPKLDISSDGGIIKQIYKEGQGNSPKVGAAIQAHYTGTLPNGEVFDSSHQRGTPFTFTLGTGTVISCWDRAFATMKVGERAMLTCRSDYAYGDQGAPPTIPPSATLQFDVELLSYKPSPKDEL